MSRLLQTLGRATLTAAAVTVGSAAWAQSMPFAVAAETGSKTFRVWTFDESSGAAAPVTEPLRFLDLGLLGHPRSDAFLVSRPRPASVGKTGFVCLPGGGAVYLADRDGEAVLLTIRADGQVDVPLAMGAGSADGVLGGLHVSSDGCHALLATDLAHGGDVFWVDLALGQVASLTADVPPLSVQPQSLRAGANVAWFVADGALHRVLVSGSTPGAVEVVALPDGPVLGEIAAAAFEDRVAVVTGADPAQRQVIVVGAAAGDVHVVTEAPGPYDLPGYDHPLGPFLIMSPDGAIVAWRSVEGGVAELFTRHVGPTVPMLHLTQEPAFPAYIDNVGVLGFTLDQVLHFVTGDQTLGGTVGLDTVSAGELFAADLSDPAAAVFANISQTGGSYEPPYDQVATLTFDRGWYDPLAQHLVVSGPQADGSHSLTTISMSGYGVGTATATPLSGVEDAPDLWSLSDGLLVANEPPEVESPGGKDDDETEIELSLGVLAVGETGAFQLSSLLNVPDGLELDRPGVERDGPHVAFVLEVDDLGELPVAIDRKSGLVVFPTWPVMMAVSQAVAFSSSGSLYFGIGKSGAGPKVHARWIPGLGSSVLPLPKRDGFPLPH